MTSLPLLSPPSDGITSLSFSLTTTKLCVSSWDKTVRLYETMSTDADTRTSGPGPVSHTGSLLCSFTQSSGVLCARVSNDARWMYAAGMDKELVSYDVSTGMGTVLGMHEAGIRCLEEWNEGGMLITGGWDKNVKFWDKRANKAQATALQTGKVFAMCMSGNRVVVATSDRQINIYDVRNTTNPEQMRMSMLQHQTRCVRSSPDGKMFVVSSIEGRIAVEYFDESPAEQAKKYSFKCHRATSGENQIVYPVNALAFHPKFGTFASGGCDGLVCVWNAELKKRTSQLPPFPTSIAALDFDSTGELLAIASSYTYEQGQKEHPADAIYIRRVTESEVKSRPKHE